MNIEQDIKHWDGKSSSDIAAIYDRYRSNDDFIPNIIRLNGADMLQKGATWLLKRYFEEGGEIEESQSSAVFKSFEKLWHWEARLQILQCLPHMEIANKDKKCVERFLRCGLTDSNKFIRAWAYNGFYVLATQYPEYREETQQFFEMAMRDEAASVKARIRNIMKKGF